MVLANQSRASGYTDYQAHDGLESAGFGFTAIRLLGSAADSPITPARTQKVLVLAAAYRW